MGSIAAEDRDAIADAKARYCRCLDEKDWDGYADVFAEDAVLDTRPSGGSEVVGRDALSSAVRRAIGKAATAHQVHSPEMTRVDDDTIDVIWAMQDRVARSDGGRSLTGYGHYRERYVRCADARWRIGRSVLTRLHIDFD